MNTTMYLMSNDTKWLEREDELPFSPYPGLTIDGLAGEQSLRINSVSYHLTEKFFKIRLSWLSPDAMTSEELLRLDVGWHLFPLA